MLLQYHCELGAVTNCLAVTPEFVGMPVRPPGLLWCHSFIRSGWSNSSSCISEASICRPAWGVAHSAPGKTWLILWRPQSWQQFEVSAPSSLSIPPAHSQSLPGPMLLALVCWRYLLWTCCNNVDHERIWVGEFGCLFIKINPSCFADICILLTRKSNITYTIYISVPLYLWFAIKAWTKLHWFKRRKPSRCIWGRLAPYTVTLQDKEIHQL